MTITTMPTSRRGSVDSKHGPTFVNFSTPGRTMSLKSESSRWKEQEEEAAAKKEDGGDEVLPYRPVSSKNNLIQLHVTGSVSSVAVASRPGSILSRPGSSNNASRPSLQIGRPSIDARRPSIDETSQPSIPTRSSSLSKRFRGFPGHSRPPPSPSPSSGSFRFQQTPTLTRTPWEIERGRPGSRWSRNPNPSTLPVRIFRELPREIYQCIIDHVEKVHMHRGLLDIPGSRADLATLCLVDRRWHRIAREHLYRDLWLPSNKAAGKRKFLRQPKKSKLKLLQSTLSNAPGIAFLVHSMHVTTALADEIETEANGSSLSRDSVLAILQDMVQQCYNLEGIKGFIPQATTATFPLFEALATRTRLRTQAWNLDSTRTLPSLGAFINCHDEWKTLETLIIAGDVDVDLGKVAISAVLGRLPALKHLMLSGLHTDDFHNGSLLALPALKSLRLERMMGITDQGIQQLAYSRLAPTVERLSLIGLELTSLEMIEALLLHLTRLRDFIFVQSTSPEPRVWLEAMNKAISFKSISLQYLHWDCLVPGTAVTRFAEAIQKNHFPQLRKVKIPCDFDGQIQLLCRPIPRVKLTQKDINYFNDHTQGKYERNLLISRIQAQLRIRESGRKPSFSFVVQDESNEVNFTHTIGSYIGVMESRIEYSLEAEVDSAALAEFDEVARPRRTGDERLERRVDVMALF